MRLGLTQKIFGGYLVLISVLGLIGGFGGVALYQLVEDYRVLVTKALPAERLLYGMEEVFRLQSGNEKKYAVVGGNALARLIREQNAEWQTDAAQLAPLLTGSESAASLKRLVAHHQVYGDGVEAWLDGGRERPSGVVRESQIRAVAAGHRELVAELAAGQDAAVETIRARRGRVVGITLALGLATVLVGLMAAYGISVLLTRPVRRLRAATDDVAKRIFSGEIPVQSTDEIGDLAASFNRMARDLASADALRDEFITYASHELKTPLTSLREANALMVDGVAGELSARQRELTGIIHEDCVKIQRLISEMLDLSLMEAGRMPFLMEPCEFAEVAAAAMDELHPVAESRDIALVSRGGTPVTVSADAGRIRQVLTNLLSNAIKFSPPGATVSVAWTREDDRVVASVADDGPGIPHAARENIFEKYHQLAPSDLSGMRGTGLGLPISRQIVESHGGSLWLTCPAAGGSTFHFSLPLASTSARVGDRVRINSAALVSSGSKG